MKVVKTNDLRVRAKELLDEASSGETIVISRPRNQNVVVLSEEVYNLMREATKVGLPIIEKEQRKQQRKADLKAAEV